MKISRRKFIERTLVAGAGIAALATGGHYLLKDKKSRPGIPNFSLPEGKTVKVGIIGVGSRGNGHLQYVQHIKGMELVAICDVVPFRLENALKRLDNKDIKQYSDYHKMVKDTELDAVIIATPLSTHYEICVAAIAAGKHVFCEKTMTYHIDEALDLVKRVDNSDIIFQVGYQHMYNPLLQEMKKIVNDGILGEVQKVECFWNRNGDWRRGVPKEHPELERLINWRMYLEYSGGLMAELSSHQMGIVHWIFDTHPEKIVGLGGIDYWKDGRETYDNANVIFDHPNGMKVSYTCLTTNAKEGFALKFYGKNGSMDCRWGLGNTVIYPERSAKEELLEKVETVDALTGASMHIFDDSERETAKVIAPGYDGAEPSCLAVYTFAQNILEHKQPLTDVRFGAKESISVRLANCAMRDETIERWIPEFTV